LVGDGPFCRSFIVKRFIISLAIAAALTGLHGSLAQAEEGWKFPNLNPFSKSEPATAKPATARTAQPATARAGSASSTGSWWPMSGSTATAKTGKPKSNEPSTWDKMNSSTKSAWTKTKQTLMPWQEEEPPVRRPVTGTNRVAASNSANKPAEKKGYFSNWFTEEEKTSKPKTVNDFLAQPKPDF
jgi:hypothetical protein